MRMSAYLRAGLVLVVLSLMSTVAIAQQYRTTREKVAVEGTLPLPGSAFDSGIPNASDAGSSIGSAGRGGRIRRTTEGVLECAPGRNGGATDVGVSATRIRLASTMVQTGIGASFLGLSPIGMKAVVARVNKSGGICGRTLDLTLVDDEWRADRGQTFIQNFIKEGYFALPVVPSSEGLTAAIEAGDIQKAGIPVVGSDGMLIQQYRSPWVWPVAAATVSTMRIMAKHAYDQGARSFGILYDQQYRFGKEGAEAFRAQVKLMTGQEPRAFVGVQPGRASYSTDIQKFNEACGQSGCEFVALLLEPATAETLIVGRPHLGTKLTGAAQTLFNERFAKNCGVPCAGMYVWTGYNPPIGTLTELPGVKQYVNDVKLVRSTVDETNQFMEGAYLGMSVFVEALRLTGPELTRRRLQQVLNQMSHTSDLASHLVWTADRRHANFRAQAFSIVVAQGSFAGFQNAQTGFVPDPSIE